MPGQRILAIKAVGAAMNSAIQVMERVTCRPMCSLGLAKERGWLRYTTRANGSATRRRGCDEHEDYALTVS
ncbi:hypothetical protein PSAB6_260089 [Paraburkholderia sabiae]|nr:hypothetical protein PSAB6_260089 [Paraburkholderia sabiae]